MAKDDGTVGVNTADVRIVGNIPGAGGININVITISGAAGQNRALIEVEVDQTFGRFILLSNDITGDRRTINCQINLAGQRRCACRQVVSSD